MARYRRIETKIWGKKEFFSLSKNAQLIYFHLLTNPFSNGIGLYQASIEGLAHHVDMVSTSYRHGVDELINGGLMRYDIEYQVVYLTKFFEQEKPSNPAHFTSLLNEIEEIPGTVLKSQFINDLLALSEQWGEKYRDAVDMVSTWCLRDVDMVSTSSPQSGTGTGTGTGTEEKKQAKKDLPVSLPVDEKEHSTEIEHKEKQKAPSEVVQVFDYWKSVLNHPNSKLDDKRRTKIKNALRLGYTVSQLCQAVDGCSKSAWHMGQNDDGKVFDSVDLIFRNADKIDSFIAKDSSPPIAKTKTQQKWENVANTALAWAEQGSEKITGGLLDAPKR